MDGSGSIGAANFELSKEFVAGTIDSFDIGDLNAKVGVVQYGIAPRSEINLGQINDKMDLIPAVRNIT